MDRWPAPKIGGKLRQLACDESSRIIRWSSRTSFCSVHSSSRGSAGLSSWSSRDGPSRAASASFTRRACARRPSHFETTFHLFLICAEFPIQQPGKPVEPRSAAEAPPASPKSGGTGMLKFGASRPARRGRTIVIGGRSPSPLGTVCPRLAGQTPRGPPGALHRCPTRHRSTRSSRDGWSLAASMSLIALARARRRRHRTRNLSMTIRLGRVDPDTDLAEGAMLGTLNPARSGRVAEINCPPVLGSPVRTCRARSAQPREAGPHRSR